MFILVPVQAGNNAGDHKAVGPFENFEAAKQYAIQNGMVASHYPMTIFTPQSY